MMGTPVWCLPWALQGERQSFGKAKMTIPGIKDSSSIYRRSSQARVLGETQSGQLPRAPDGRLEPRPAGAIGPIDWRHVGPDLTRGTEG
ncbi:hypothetical protein TIFTF001_015771 [Ficus carica]|uniref:Uncharacterized protein n=1 Tax=Ficus carica TaxID=3494 RepID=A0AA87ZZ84_FICCA|nr:hypothetical protein TIFTF001_015771 [Ficus carica]